MSSSYRLVAGLTLGLSAAAAWAQVPEPVRRSLAEVQLPALDAVDETVRIAIEERYRALRDLELEGASREQAARLYGQLGHTFSAHEFRDAAAICYSNARVLEPESARWPYLLGVLEIENARLEEALELLEDARDLAPDHLPTLIRIGNTALKMADAERADGAFSAARRVAPDSAAVFCGLGRLASLQDRLEDSVAAFERCLELQPSANRYHAALASALKRIGRTDEARSHVELYGTADVAFADPWLEEIRRAGVGQDALLDRATAALEREQLVAAVRLFEEAIAADPKDQRARKGLATLRQRTGDLTGAESLYREIVARSPNDALAHFNLASLLAQRGEAEEAIAHFRSVVRIDPEDADAKDKLSWLLEQQGLIEEALVLRSELALDDLEGSRLHQARLLLRLNRSAEALEVLEEHLKRRPADLAGHLARASTHMMRGECDAARSGLRTATAAVSTPRPLEHALARSWLTCQDPAGRDAGRGLAIASRLFEESPTPEVAETLALGHALNGNYEDAARLQKQLIEQARGQAPPAVLERLKSALARYEAALAEKKARQESRR